MKELLKKVANMELGTKTLTSEAAHQWFEENPRLKFLKLDYKKQLVDEFYTFHQRYLKGDMGLIDWDKKQPLQPNDVVSYDALPKQNSTENYKKLVVLKLNGGLGTGMGLSGPKSLISARKNKTFMDLILEQEKANTYELALMNSFSTQAATNQYLISQDSLDRVFSFEQNLFPRIDAKTKLPVHYRSELYHEDHFNPPGHGDFPRALVYSGVLDDLIARGIEYAFISNSDNLGASPDPRILEYMIANNMDFLMEVTDKTKNDVKGGTLIRYSVNGESRLMLLEQAQTPEANIKEFEDIQTFKYFNTNNIWINLKSLKKLMTEGTLAEQLPLIINPKKGKDIFGDDAAPDVVQYEQAMGGLIGAFSKSGAVNVSRKRFSPVKTTEDSFRLLSNLYREDNGMLVMADDVAELPKVKLDPRYKKIKGFDQMVAGVDAINFDRDVRSLEIVGPFIFKGTITFRGENIRLVNNSLEPRVLTDEEISGTKEYGEVSPANNQGGGQGKSQQGDQGQDKKKDKDNKQ